MKVFGRAFRGSAEGLAEVAGGGTRVLLEEAPEVVRVLEAALRRDLLQGDRSFNGKSNEKINRDVIGANRASRLREHSRVRLIGIAFGRIPAFVLPLSSRQMYTDNR